MPAPTRVSDNTEAPTRTGDPTTSKAVRVRTGTHRERVFEHIVSTGGATYAEAMDALSISQSSAATRISELVQMGLLQDSGKTRLTNRGSEARIMVPTPHALDQINKGVPLAELVKKMKSRQSLSYYICSECKLSFSNPKDQYIEGEACWICEAKYLKVTEDEFNEHLKYHKSNGLRIRHGSSEEGWYRVRKGPYTGPGIEPVFEYKPPDDYKFPHMVHEENVDDDSVIRVVSLPEMNKYGNCYEIIYINKPKRMMKRMGLARSIPGAMRQIPELIAFARERKAAK